VRKALHVEVELQPSNDQESIGEAVPVGCMNIYGGIEVQLLSFLTF
jgi:hypothetical protein